MNTDVVIHRWSSSDIYFDADALDDYFNNIELPLKLNAWDCPIDMVIGWLYGRHIVGILK